MTKKIALAFIIPVKTDMILQYLSEIIATYRKSSTTFVNNSICVLAGWCKADDDFKESLFSICIIVFSLQG